MLESTEIDTSIYLPEPNIENPVLILIDEEYENDLETLGTINDSGNDWSSVESVDSLIEIHNKECRLTNREDKQNVIEEISN
jgi:hypothetical protein